MSTHNLLAGLLAAQVALAAVTWWPSDTGPVQATPLLEGGGNSLESIEILAKGDDAEPVRLRSEGGTWVVESAHGHPADADKIAEVIDALGGVQLRAPIATRAVSHESLGVDDAGFEKKVTYTADGETQTLYIGAAASKAVHLRVDGADEVYKIKGLSAWSLRDQASAYLPTNALELDTADVNSLTITNAQGTITFVRMPTDDGAVAGWTVDGRPDLVADAAAVDGLVEKVSKVRLSDVLGTEVTPEHGLTDSPVRVEWSVAEGGTTVSGGMVIGAEADSKYTVKLDDSAFVFTSPTYRLKDLVQADSAELTSPAPEPAETVEE